jgi:hypothetical protein
MTLPSTAVDTIRSLSPIGLDELERVAALTERKDRKYLIPGGVFEELIQEIDAETKVLEINGERAFRYETIYFDTPGLDAYLMAARSRPQRVKVRTRSYLDSGVCHLEVKAKNREGATIKYRTPHRFESRDRFTSRDLAFISETDPSGLARDRLEPVLTVRYVRTTLVDPGLRARVTIDTELEAVDRHGRAVSPGGFVIVETKSERHATPFDRRLWVRHVRPLKMSKYCTLMAVIDPSLPANKWSRTLRDHFDWKPIREGS